MIVGCGGWGGVRVWVRGGGWGSWVEEMMEDWRMDGVEGGDGVCVRGWSVGELG